MKALIQKDLRENLKVALIGLLIFSLLLLAGYQSSIAALKNLISGVGYASGQNNALQPLLAVNLLVEMAFFCALFGAALGWLQTRNEAHRDLWAFLIHRPVTRSKIFGGKAIAGLCLYSFGAGLPLAVFVAVARMPGHVAAPFEWAMVLPSLSIFLTGIGYYFAGLLTGLRQARWYASRSFGLGVAIMTSAGVFGLPLWMSLVLIVIATAILAAAAWGAYQSGGYYGGQPAAGRLALTAAMTAGCAVALYVCIGLLFALVLNPLLPRPASVFSTYQMTRDGTIYKETHQNMQEMEISDLDGHPLLDPKTGKKMKYFPFAPGGLAYTNLKKRSQISNPIENSQYFFNLQNVSDKTLWYLDRHGKIIGYDGQTRKYVGGLDPHGEDGRLASEPFLRNSTYNYYNPASEVQRSMNATARAVYQVDYLARTVKSVFAPTNDDEIGGCFDGGQSVSNFFITTRTTVSLMDYDGKSIFTLPYQPGYWEYPQVQVSFLQNTNGTMNHFAVWFYPDYELNEKTHWKMPVHVRWLGPEQAVTKTADLPFLRPDEAPAGAIDWPDKMATALLPPPAHLEFNRKIYSAWNLFSCALAAIGAGIGWTLVRRYNFSIKAPSGWTLFIFLLGIPGLLALLCVQEWPVRETCPHCKKPRAVDRESCEHCAAPFAPPETNGTEIFEPLTKA
jgi:ABC-type transport system involved in multi-copper enzyme maturation permease subunit